MARRVLSLVLSLCLVFGGPGLRGWEVLAEEKLNSEGRATVGVDGDKLLEQRPPNLSANAPQVDDIMRRLKQNLPEAQAGQVERFLKQNQGYFYSPTAGPEVVKALEELAAIDPQAKDMELAMAKPLSQLFDFAKKREELATYTNVLEVGPKSQKVAVERGGRKSFIQDSDELDVSEEDFLKVYGPGVTSRIEKSWRKSVTRPYPNDPARLVMDAVLVHNKWSAANEQEIAYNRKLVSMFNNIKKFYYDQCSLVRKINNGEKPPRLNARECALDKDGKEDIDLLIGTNDPKLTAAAIADMVAVYTINREGYLDPYGNPLKSRKPFPREILEYLDKIGKMQAAGEIDGLAKKGWLELMLMAKDLKKVQNAAMAYYQERQLETIQKMGVIQLSTYLSQVTNTQPKQKKDGKENLDPTLKDLDELQNVITEFEKGNLEGYGILMDVMGLTKIDPNSEKYVTPDILALAAEAFAFISYAVQAKERALATQAQAETKGGSKEGQYEEMDAALEEMGHWLRLAQNRLQKFELKGVAIQLTRLRDGELRDHVGLDDPDDGDHDEEDRRMHAQLQKLLDRAEGQHLSTLDEVSDKAKLNLLKQLIASFDLTLRSAELSNLQPETLKRRVRVLAAKAGQIRALYIAREFNVEKVRQLAAWREMSVAQRVRGSVYKLFLDNLAPDVKAAADRLDKLVEALNAVLQHSDPDTLARELLKLQPEFEALARIILKGDIPGLSQLKEEAQKLAMEESMVGRAVSAFSAKARIFDMVNELDLYVRKYGSSETVESKSDGVGSYLLSFKWMDSAMNFLSGGFLNLLPGVDNVRGGRDIAVDATMHGMLALTDPETWRRLGSDHARTTREAVLDFLREGKIDAAIERIAEMDPEAADRARKEFEADKAAEDPFDEYDLETLLTRTPSDVTMAKAQAVMNALFGSLQNYILAYNAASAVVDTVITTVATAGLGLIWRGFVNAGRGAIAAIRAAEMAHVAGAMVKLNRVQRLLAVVSKNRVGKWAVGYLAKMLLSQGRGIRNALGLAHAGTKYGMGVNQIGVALKNAFLHTAKMTGIMGLAGALMQMGMKWWQGDSSHHTSYFAAFKEGLLSGAAFGAKTSLLMMLSPFQLSAMGTSFIPRMLKNLAQSPGGVSSLVSFGVKSSPGLARTAAGQSIVRSGLWAGVSDAALYRSLAFRQLVMAPTTFVLGMADGALKFFFIAEIPRNIAEVANYAWNRYWRGGKEGKQAGATTTVYDMSNAATAGMTVAMASWLFLPVASATHPRTIKQQKEMMHAVSHLIRASKISFLNGEPVITGPLARMMKPGEKIHYTKPFLARSLWEHIKREKTGVLEVSEHVVGMANRYFLGKMQKAGRMGDIALLSTLNTETHGGVRNLKELSSGNSPARVSVVDSWAMKDARDISREATDSTKAQGQKPEKAYIVFNLKGRVEKVSRTAMEGDGLFTVEVSILKDGTYELSASAPKNAEAVTRVGQKKVAEALSQINAEVRPFELKAGEIFISRETVAEAEAMMERHLASGFWRGLFGLATVRDRILEEGATSFEIRNGDKGTTVKIEGEAFAKLRKMASWAEVNSRSLGFLGYLRENLLGEEAGLGRLKFWKSRVWKILTDRHLESRSEILLREIKQEAEAQAKAASRLPLAERVKAVLELAVKLKTTNLADAQAVSALIAEAQKPGATPEALAQALAKAIDKASASLALNLKFLLALMVVGENADPLADALTALRETKEGSAFADVLDPLIERVSGEKKPNAETAVGELQKAIDSSSGDLKAELQKVKDMVEEARSPKAIIEFLSKLSEKYAADAREISELVKSLELAGSDQAKAQSATARLGKMIREGVGEKENKTLDLLARSLKGELTSGQAVDFVRSQLEAAVKEAGEGSLGRRLSGVLEVLKGEPTPERMKEAARELEAAAKAETGAKAEALKDLSKGLEDQAGAQEGVKSLIQKLTELKTAGEAADVKARERLLELLGKDAASQDIGALLKEIDGMIAEGVGLPEHVLKNFKETLLPNERVEGVVKLLEALRDSAQGAEREALVKLLEKLSPKKEGSAGESVVEVSGETALREIQAAIEQGLLPQILEPLKAELFSAPGIKTVLAKLELRHRANKGVNSRGLENLIELLRREGAPRDILKSVLEDLELAVDEGSYAGATGKALEAVAKEYRETADKAHKEAVESALAALRRIKSSATGEDAAALQKIIEKLETGKIGDAISAAEKLMELKGKDQSLGADAGTLRGLEARLKGDVVVEQIVEFADRAVKGKAEAAKADGETAYANALGELRQSLASDAFLKYANERVVAGINAYKKTKDDKALEKDIQFLIDAWHRGVFGQMFKTRVEKNGEVIWDIPEQYQFKDANGNRITSLRPNQLSTIKEDLLQVAKGNLLIFDLLESSGGKTLLGIVLVTFMEAFAKSRGKEGALFVTSNADLVVQVKEAYKAFFKGKKASFDIITYSDLMLQEAMARESGEMSPFEKYEVFMDELDQLGLETALSLGEYQGQLSFAFDPVQRSLRDGVDKVFRELYEKYGGQKLSHEEFQEKLKTEADFKVEYQALKKQVFEKARKALEDIMKGRFEIPDQYMKEFEELGWTKEMVKIQMIKEYRDAFGDFFTLGAVEGKHGGLEGWVDAILEGAYQAASEGADLAKLYMVDPGGKGLIQFHNDTAHPSLDTFYRTALELREGLAITLPFETAAVVRFRDVLEAARDYKALAIGASGTLPNKMRPFLQNELGMHITKGGNDPTKISRLPHMLFSESRAQRNFAVDRLEALAKKEGNHLGVGWVDSIAKKDLLLRELAARGITEDQIAVMTEPGAAFFMGERYDTKYKDAKKRPEFLLGKVKIMLFVGQNGLRGLEAQLKEYVGGDIFMYVMDAHLLPEANLSQVLERIGAGRRPGTARARWFLLDDVAGVMDNKLYRSVMPNLVRMAANPRYMDRLWTRIETKFAEVVAKAGTGQAVSEAAIQREFKTPEFSEVVELYKDYQVLRRLKNAVGEEMLKQAAETQKKYRGSPKGTLSREMEELLSDKDVADILSREMFRQNESQILRDSLSEQAPQEY